MSLGSTIALIKTLASGGGGGGGTNVVANPTLAGTEADLTGLQVGDTKYKVGGSSGGGVLVVTENENHILNHTWQEIHDAGFAVLYDLNEEGLFEIAFLSILGETEGIYVAYFWAAMSQAGYPYSTDSASGYPVFTSG